MRIFDTFSKRKKKKELAGKVDVFEYDNLPQAFRNQMIHLLRDAIGPFDNTDEYHFHLQPSNNEAWLYLFRTLTRELGALHLSGSEYSHAKEQYLHFVLTAKTDGVLDAIELAFKLIDTHIRSLNHFDMQEKGIALKPDDAISELNHRFFEHRLGYQFINGELTRVDSQLIHEKSVKPALALIHEEGFEGVEDEFQKAYEHYQQGRQKDAMNEALKSFESVAKSICDKRQWSYPANATATPLLDILFQNGLIATEMQSHFSALGALLKSGVPTARNKQSGHGQGSTVKKVPDHLVAFILHSTASAIVLLIQSHKVNHGR